MTEKRGQVTIRRVQELGYHNRFTRKRALLYHLKIPQGATFRASPIPTRLVDLLTGLLPGAEGLSLRIGGKAFGLTALLRSERLGCAWLASALATVLQREVYPNTSSFGTPGDAVTAVAFYAEFKDPTFARYCSGTAVRTAEALLAEIPEDDAEIAVRAAIADHKARLELAMLNQNLRAILEGADARGIPWRRLAVDAPYVQLGHGCHLHHFRETISDQESLIPVDFQKNKILSHRILGNAGLPIPQAIAVQSAEAAVRAAEQVGYPVVVKPNFLAKGVGVFVGLRDADEVRQAYAAAAGLEAGVILESYLAGDDHRILVIDGRFVAAAKRLPAQVVGDGRSSIRELVVEENKHPLRSRGYHTLMNDIVIDGESERVLRNAGLTVESIPAAGQAVALKRTANISSGGTAVDVTEIIHPDNVAMAERAARVLGLGICGVDFLSTDISRSHFEIGGGICEMNAAVGLRPHRVADPKRDIITPILDKHFGAGGNGRIPIAAVTGTTGKTTTVRMLAGILSAAGKTVGSVTTDEVRVAGQVLAYGDLAGIAGAEIVLGDRRSEAAVLETARGGIIKRGTAFERCDVATLTNVGEDHLGEHGIETPEQMAQVKARLLHAAEKAVVLNADCPRSMALRDGLEAPRILLVAPSGTNRHVEAQLASGGEVLVLEGDPGAERLAYRKGKERRELLAAADIPATLRGTARHNAENALFAAASAIALEVPLEAILAGLTAFKADLEDSTGRLSLVDGLDFDLLVDFAHNAAQLETVTRFIDGYAGKKRRICLMTVPGNRMDTQIVASGAAAAGHFDHYICYERQDWWRGRKPGEIAELLRRGLNQAAVPEAAIEAGLMQDEAIGRAVSLANKGDFVAIFGSFAPASVPRFRAAVRGD